MHYRGFSRTLLGVLLSAGMTRYSAQAQTIAFSNTFSVPGQLLRNYFIIGSQENAFAVVETRPVNDRARGNTLTFLTITPEGQVSEVAQHIMSGILTSSGISTKLLIVEDAARMSNGNICLLGDTSLGQKLLTFRSDGSLESVVDIKRELLDAFTSLMLSAEKMRRPPIIKFTHIKGLSDGKYVLLGWIRQFAEINSIKHSAVALVCDRNNSPISVMHFNLPEGAVSLGEFETFEMWDAVEDDGGRMVCAAAPREAAFSKAVTRPTIWILGYDADGKIRKRREVRGYSPRLATGQDKLFMVYDSDDRVDRVSLTHMSLDDNLDDAGHHMVLAVDAEGLLLQYAHGILPRGDTYVAYIALEGLPPTEEKQSKNVVIMVAMDVDGRRLWQYEPDASKALGVDIGVVDVGAGTVLLLWKERVRMGVGDKRDLIRIEGIRED